MLRVKAHGQRDLITCDASGMDSLSQRDREFESASLQRGVKDEPIETAAVRRIEEYWPQDRCDQQYRKAGDRGLGRMICCSRCIPKWR
jgi:hypothetical protein